jgi:hypothetical protein
MKKMLFTLMIGLTFTSCEKDEIGVIHQPTYSNVCCVFVSSTGDTAKICESEITNNYKSWTEYMEILESYGYICK